MPEPDLRRDLDTLAETAGDHARLPSPAAVRRRADRRRAWPQVVAVAAAVAAITWGSTALVDRQQTPEARPSPTDGPQAGDPTGSPSDDPTATPPAVDPVDIRAYDGRWLVPGVEGGLVLVDELAQSPLPTSWTLEPEPDGASVRIVSTSTVDDRALCLTASDVDDALGLDLCGDRPALQSFEVVELDRPGQVNIRSASGLLITAPGGPVTTGGSPESPSTVFDLG